MEPILQKDAQWKKRFRMPRYVVEFASRNPKHALVASNKSGIFELYAYDLPSDNLRQATRRPSGTIYGTISPDGNDIYYLDDKEGNETGHVVRVPFGGGEEPKDMTPAIPDYTQPDYRVDYARSWFGITIPDEGGFSSYVGDISGGKPAKLRMINKSEKASFGPFFSADGEVSVICSAERFGAQDYDLTSFDTATGVRLREVGDESSKIEPAEFSPLRGDQRILAMSNRSGTMRPFVWDATRGTRADLDTSGVEGDVVGMGWSADAKAVLLCQTNRATTRLWTYDLKASKPSRVPHPEGFVSAARFQDDSRVLMAWEDPTNPSQILGVDLRSPSVPSGRYLAPADVPKSSPWRSVSFKSSDGQEIQCWVATPEGKGPFPTILDTHGGPTWARFGVFLPSGQVWLDHGFAYASVNYRGSTSFGKEFEKKINGDLGHWEVEDMVAARAWLVANKVARPDQVFLTGWSYGGYLTLQAMGLYPDLWAGGMGGVVVADWVSQYEDEPEAMRGYDIALMGGPLSEKRELYERASPLSYVDRLAAPLLIIQGRNDTRDPPRQVALFEAKAKSLGKDVKVVWFGTGHAGSSMDVELAIAHHETMLKWIHEVIRRR
jgi:dipeptidyl aminopeptidase/acylaminoacyl peptidase